MDGSVTYIVVFIIVGVGIFLMVKVHQCKTWYNNRPKPAGAENSVETNPSSNMTRPDELSVDIGDLSKKCDRGGLPTYEEVLAMSRQENSRQIVSSSVSR